MTMTDEQRRQKLLSLKLDPDAPALEPQRTIQRPAIQQPQAVPLAPEGVNPHTMPVTDIVFDPAMVEHFPDLSPRARNAASRYLFDLYKSPGRDKDRNSLLHRRIGEFLARVHRERETGGSFVKDKIRLANFLAEQGITEEDLKALIAEKEGK